MTVQLGQNKTLCIYFADSLSHERDLGTHRTFSHIRELLESYGNAIPFRALPPGFSKDPYVCEIQQLESADCLIVDATIENTAIGWKIAVMQRLGKPILYLYHAETHKEPSSVMFYNPHIRVHKYNPAENLESIVDSFFSEYFEISRLVLV